MPMRCLALECVWGVPMSVESVGLVVFGLCALLVLYHHAFYPLLLSRLAARCRQVELPDIPQRGWTSQAHDQVLPSIEIIMPAYNESACIADKLRNLAQLDYPTDLWRVVIVLDGCNDATRAQADRTLLEPECAGLPVIIRDFQDNGGKVMRINQAIEAAQSSLVLLSDVSALLPVDCLLALAAHFNDPRVGAVSLGYRLLSPGSEGEQAYWDYQRKIKMQESRLGCVQGAHGSGWALRRALFQPLPADTINDDFIMPMQIAAQGYRVVYESRLSALELECMSVVGEQQRRRRIAAGNTQQIARLLRLLSPQQGAKAFMFLSGKCLRVFMPYCLLGMLLANGLFLGLGSWAVALFLAQLLGYGAFIAMNLLQHIPRLRLLRVINYLLLGHWANLNGSVRYLTGRQRGVWQRVKEA
jgi:cellulose synthase/poly-beta-1,6-N-acetylglucosamine synthase-like glycosyltransferase